MTRTVRAGWTIIALAICLVAFAQVSPSRAGERAQRWTTAYDRIGQASWYGRRFHGRRTASGEIYNMHGLTAAHRSLPFATPVRVTNLQNGLSIIVRVTDRGPFSRGRIIDLSLAGAHALGLIERGVATVRVTIAEDQGHRALSEEGPHRQMTGAR